MRLPVQNLFAISLSFLAVGVMASVPAKGTNNNSTTLSASAAEQSLDEQFKIKENEALTQSDWNRLALSEMQAGLTSKGLEHERKAMQLFSSTDVAGAHSALGYLGDQVISTLTPDHPAEAEKLLVDAVERTKTVAGAKSVLTQAQIANLFVFDVHQKKYDAALKTLGQALDFDLSTGPTPSQALGINQNIRSRNQPHTAVGVVHMILLAIKEVEKTEPAFSIAAVEKVLKAQDAQLTADDERSVETLGALADAYFQVRKYKEANRYYSRAYKIAERYHPESAFAVHQCGQNFLATLREVGRSAEADRLSTLKDGPGTLTAQPLSSLRK
jgi:tetratricopeptide (TPR) repeat protein